MGNPAPNRGRDSSQDSTLLPHGKEFFLTFFLLYIMVNLLPIHGTDGEIRIVNQQEIAVGSIVGNPDGTFTLRSDVTDKVKRTVDQHVAQSKILPHKE